MLKNHSWIRYSLAILMVTAITISCKNVYYCPTNSDTNTEENLAGNYALYSTKDTVQEYRSSLLYALNTDPNADTITNWTNLDLSLELGEKSVILTGAIGDSVVYKQMLKGKWKGDFFKSRSKVKALGVPLIYFMYFKSRVYICADEESIYVRKMSSRYGNIFILSAGNTDYYHYEFMRI